MTWSVEKAESVLSLYGAAFFVVNPLGMVCVPTQLGLVEVEGFVADNDGAEKVLFNKGTETNGDELRAE